MSSPGESDGVAGTGDPGEGDGIPTAGEPNFDDTDLNESDQIGLTGFKLNRISSGQGNPKQETDNILFFTESQDWPERLYEQFTDPDPDVRFGEPLASNYNIGFLFASGPFRLAAGQQLRLRYGVGTVDGTLSVAEVDDLYQTWLQTLE